MPHPHIPAVSQCIKWICSGKCQTFEIQQLETNVKNEDDTAIYIVFCFQILAKITEWNFFVSILAWHDTLKRRIMRAFIISFPHKIEPHSVWHKMVQVLVHMLSHFFMYKSMTYILGIIRHYFRDLAIALNIVFIKMLHWTINNNITLAGALMLFLLIYPGRNSVYRFYWQ